MSNNTNKGIDVRQTGNQLVFRSFLTTGGAALSTGTTTIQLAELQSDGTVKTYDFTSNTFKTSGMTNGGQTGSMTERTILTYSAGDAQQHVGLWTYALSTLTGFTTGAIYLAVVQNASADAPLQMREFQYGSEQGDLVVTANGTGVGELNVDLKMVLGTAPTATTSGILDVNSKNINNVSAVSVTTINANIGTTQAAQYDGNNLPKVDVEDWKAAAAPAMTGDSYARLGAPAGASAAADIAAINSKTTNLPTSPASTTNITAGTIATVTNLTNAPSNGDLTAAMKASITTAATAATPTAAGVTGLTTTTIAAAVWNTIIASATSAGSIMSSLLTFLTGYSAAPSAGTIANATAAAILKTPGNLLVTNSDGSVDATVDTGSIAAAVLSGLGGATITVVSPLSQDGSLLWLVTGDSYTVANGRSLTFNITGQTALIGTVPHIRLAGSASDLAVAPAIVSGTQTIVFNDIPASSTTDLTPSTNTPYQVRFDGGSGNVATIVKGFAQIDQGL